MSALDDEERQRRRLEAYQKMKDKHAAYDKSKEYLQAIEVEEETTNFGSDIPDVSHFPQLLAEHQSLPLNTFKEDYSLEEKYVNELSYDPLQAKYFELFMDASKRPPSHGRQDDMSFTPDQIAAFKKNGFVVTNKNESSMAFAYYKIYNNDLPVLITTDSILHAFHYSYDKVLEGLETNFCSEALKKTFSGMRQSLNKLAPNFSSDPFKQCFKDADYFLAVGYNLLSAEEHIRAGTPEAVELGKKRAFEATQPEWNRRENLPLEQIATILGSDVEVEDALKACKASKKMRVNLFGKEREVDFTLFKPRGHYTKTAALRQYFRAMNWLGEIDMIIAGEGSNFRQLGAAVVLHMLLNHNTETSQAFQSVSRLIEALVGPNNSMDPQQLDIVLDKVFKLKNFESINSDEALSKLQTKILETDLGAKRYNNGNWRSFTFMGKKFTIDSWAQTRFVHDETQNKIIWEGNKVERRSTSSVEVAFAVLGNNAATTVIHERIQDQNSSKKFRDGLVYHHQLVSARKLIDGLPAGAWSGSVYMYWLAALRQLSVPLDERYPQAMRTKAYAMKNMNAQLASWAQLRHDNMLYVEQGRGFGPCCVYPDGYVEPFVEFWQAMERMCMATAQAMQGYPGGSKFFSDFAKRAKVLREISVLELAGQPLLPEHTYFLKSVVEYHESSGIEKWTGWYPTLYYGGTKGLKDPDLIACDTYTSHPSQTSMGYDPGCVVHQALGFPRKMIMAVENGTNSTVYCGPVFGFYEFELPGLQRLNDQEWKAKVWAKQTPPLPEWTSSYLIST